MSAGNHESDQIKHYLGIDYGKSDVGLALADEETKMAFVYKTIKNDKKFLQNLAEIIEKENVKIVVMGIPSYIYPHTNSEISKNQSYKIAIIDSKKTGVRVNRQEVIYEAEELGKFLEENLKVEVKYQNEMFTTKMAQANLIERHVKDIKRFDDQEAAKIILQEWLDNREV